VPPAHYLDYKLAAPIRSWSTIPRQRAASRQRRVRASALRGLHADVVLLGIALREDLPTYLHEVVDASAPSG